MTSSLGKWMMGVAVVLSATVASAIDLVVHAELRRGGQRQVHEIVAPTGRIVNGALETVTLFERSAERFTATKQKPPRSGKFDRADLDPTPILGAT